MVMDGPTFCCHAGSAQAFQQASVHTIEGGTEKLLSLTVPVPWQRASIGLRPVHPRDSYEDGRKGCCTSDLPMPLGEESNVACTRTTWVS